nr:MAG TPA: hypothetical protein [Caudoviricetes sp.]
MIHVNPTTIDVALILSVISLITIAGRFIYRTTIFMDRISTMLNVWNGKDGTPSILERLEDMEDKLKDVQYHVKPNHGGSSVDAQNRQLREIISYLKEKNNG